HFFNLRHLNTEEEEAASSEEDSSSFRGSGVCKWFNVRMGFGFLSMTHREGICLDSPVDVFVHQSKLHMEGFRSLKEGEAVEFTFKRSSKGLESLRVTGTGGAPCVGSEKKPKGTQKRRSKGDRCPIKIVLSSDIVRLFIYQKISFLNVTGL
uniref:Lin-28 homolog A (C. elegans) n=1 Tax=Sinocyclocheilus grahami TaxID=75366 RepID=A0A672L744_SINGR